MFNKIRSYFARPPSERPNMIRDAIAKRNPNGMMKHLQDIDSYKTGGTVKKTGLAYLHKGETVVPKKVSQLKALKNNLRSK